MSRTQGCGDLVHHVRGNHGMAELVGLAQNSGTGHGLGKLWNTGDRLLCFLCPRGGDIGHRLYRRTVFTLTYQQRTTDVVHQVFRVAADIQPGIGMDTELAQDQK